MMHKFQVVLFLNTLTSVLNICSWRHNLVPRTFWLFDMKDRGKICCFNIKKVKCLGNEAVGVVLTSLQIIK